MSDEFAPLFHGVGSPKGGVSDRSASAGSAESCAKRSGRLAYNNGERLASNPYFPDILNARQWAEGWIEESMGWLGIESAPKDGTHFLGFTEDAGIHETYMTKYHPKSSGYASGRRDSGWYFHDITEQWCMTWKPTHWMPRPQMPNDHVQPDAAEQG